MLLEHLWTTHPAGRLLSGYKERAAMTDVEKVFQGLRVVHQYDGIKRAAEASNPDDLSPWLARYRAKAASWFSADLQQATGAAGLLELGEGANEYFHLRCDQEVAQAQQRFESALGAFDTIRTAEWHSVQIAHGRLVDAFSKVEGSANPGWKKSLAAGAAGLAVAGTLGAVGLGFLLAPALLVPLAGASRDHRIKSSGVFEREQQFRFALERCVKSNVAGAIKAMTAEFEAVYRLRVRASRELAEAGWDVAKGWKDSLTTASFTCPNCAQIARLPADCGPLKVTCSSCGQCNAVAT